jgi:light-regulated signal transduction histidine kinase (bacteriophytochrome)
LNTPPQAPSNGQPVYPGPADPVTLENCAREPIHIPGHIQPHGALLVFGRDAALTGWSANASAMLGLAPVLDCPAAALGLAPDVLELLGEALAESETDDTPPMALETVAGGRQFDCVMHGHAGQVLVEFELREQPSDAVAAFALKAHAAIDRLKRQKSLPALLQIAVEQVRAITGFDRVMAYRFRHDDSGDVVAEARIEALEPYLGRRYPASDIPAQARRLYVLNTLRLIADVGYRPVPVLGRPGEPPLDMSHCTMRSVSPVHIEYLQNMGVGASMSVSIVVNGRLWGLLACHHAGPRQVPYSIRMACDVLAQVLASTAQSLDARERTALIEQAAEARTGVMETLLHEDDVLRALGGHAGPLRISLGADALILAEHGKLVVNGELPPELAGAIVRSLPRDGAELFQHNALADWPEDIRGVLGKWVGLLALRFDPISDGWLLALRVEQVETLRWGGRPEKHVTHGPLGPRLTPRGSFDEWRETVRGSAEPWDESRLAVANQLLAEIHRASMARHAELERTRTQLLAMLGHDLRDPLHSISMAAMVLEQGEQQQKLGRRITASSNRMQRLISQVLDMSRIQGGIGLGLSFQPVDLAWLLADLADEALTAHPALQIELDLPPALAATADADRIVQVIGNLISNARHHGEAGEPIRISLRSDGGRFAIEVRNVGREIDEALAANLFNPFKRSSLNNVRNRGGLGLGLYIAHQIVQAHQGSITYRYEAPHVVFSVEAPLLPAKH